LVVDDEPNMCFVVRTILEGEGYTVIEAPNGAVALERTKESQPDVIVTDLMMPVMGGVDLIERLPAGVNVG
jgi:CheY-like chemotaxis protein